MPSMPNTHRNGLLVALVLLASAVVAAAPQGPAGPRVEPAAAPSHELVITVADAGEAQGRALGAELRTWWQGR